MDQSFYHRVTNAAAATITQLTVESRGHLDQDNQSYWDMAQGVVRLWITITGPDGEIADLEFLNQLVDGMAHVDSEGDGRSWSASPVVHMK